MMTSSAEQEPSAHIDIPLPAPPAATYFNETQWRVFYALVDTAIPSLAVKDQTSSIDAYEVSQSQLDSFYEEAKRQIKSPPRRADFVAFLSEKPSNSPAFRANATKALAALPEHARTQLGSVMGLLGTRLGSAPLTGYFRPFYDIPVEGREKVLQSWQASYLALLRTLAKSVVMLAARTWLQTSPLFGQLTGWTDLPEGYKVGKSAEYAFKQFEAGTQPEVVETDIVIVGSGCGGAVCAKVLAEAGHRVLVVDKGYYFSPAQLPLTGEKADHHLFEGGGLTGSDDSSMGILAGSTWGGGGSINWGVSLQTPDYVRKEWAEKRGLTMFASKEFQESLDRVCDFMGVSDSLVRQNHRGQVLLDGAKKLGWKAKVTPHNSGNKDHDCGHCHLGCGSGGKQGPAVSWLPAAAKAGAEMIEGFQVERVTFEDFASGKKASGVVGKWISRDKNGGLNGLLDERVTRDVTIKAKRVIVSCGTIWSPVILRNSGLANPQIGKNLYLHPVQQVTGYWKEEVEPWKGCAITSVCTTFEDLDGEGNGVKIEPMCMVPSLVLPQSRWRSGLDYKMQALRYRHMNVLFSMARDRDTGSVYPDPKTGKPRINYTPSAFDRANTLEGIVACARICYVMGAEEIRAPVAGVGSFVREASDSESDAGDARFEKWLDSVRAAGSQVTDTRGTAHQMGTCRMSKSQQDGVVDPHGKVWGVEGLYVADASVFPSASGVNPMITNMAVSDTIAHGIAVDLGAPKNV